MAPWSHLHLEVKVNLNKRDGLVSRVRLKTNSAVQELTINKIILHIISSQTCSKLRNDSIEDSTGDNLLEENRKGFYPSHQIQVGRIDIT